MSDEEQVGGNKRRVYDLPLDLVGRVVEYQKSRGLTSEVEAVRKLLDLALKESDTMEGLIYRVAQHLRAGGDFGEASRDVLAGHPKVTKIVFEDDAVRFDYQDRRRHEEIRVYSGSHIEMFSNPGTDYEVSLVQGVPRLEEIILF